MGRRFGNAIGRMAVLGFAGLFAMLANADPDADLYELHVKCNEAYRESPAYVEQSCKLNKVNHDHLAYPSYRSQCFVDIRCWAQPPSVHPHLPAEWVGYKGVLDVDAVKQLRLCYSSNEIGRHCRTRS